MVRYVHGHMFDISDDNSDKAKIRLVFPLMLSKIKPFLCLRKGRRIPSYYRCLLFDIKLEAIIYHIFFSVKKVKMKNQKFRYQNRGNNLSMIAFFLSKILKSNKIFSISK